MPLVCCQLVRKGRYVVAEPWFEPGRTITLGDAKRRAGDVGTLALVVANHKHVGHVVEVLGPIASVHAAMRGLLAEAGLLGDVPAPNRPMGQPSRAVLAQLEALPTDIPFADTREDRRADLVMTIDPPTAKDHDDALGLERADADADHAWRLAVHIADVSAYVPTGSPIDVEAERKAMSAYVPGAVAPMLPHELSSDLCSLRPGVDRGCVSVFADVAEDGEIVRVRFARTLIRSARRLSYDQVDEVLAGDRSIDTIVDAQLRELDEVTQLLRTQRMKRGALDMALPEVELTLGELDPEEARLAPESPSHRLVEECMLVANDAVGAHLAKEGAPGMWRVHDHPEGAAIQALFKTFEQLGVPTPPLPDDFTGKQAAAIAADAARRAQQYAETAGRGVRSFAPRVLRALQRAEYRARTGPHSGLATEHYAHFTSPIRRYPDLVVHRSLLQLLGIGIDEPASGDIGTIARHVSTVERDLQQLERRADRIAIAYLLHNRMHSGGEMGDDGSGTWAGEVVGMIAHGLFVRFGDVFEGFVPARTLAPDERYELDEFGLALVGTKSGHQIRLGDSIDVYVDKVDRSNGKVDLRRVSGRATANRVREDAASIARRVRRQSQPPQRRRR